MPGNWLNTELQFDNLGGSHAVQVQLASSVTGTEIVNAASGFLVSADNFTFGTTANVSFSNGVGTVYVQNNAVGPNPFDLAMSSTSNGTISAGTTLFTIGGTKLQTPSLITTYDKFIGTLIQSPNFAQGTLMLTIPYGSLSSTSTNYYYVGIKVPTTSEQVWVQITVNQGANIGNADYQLSIPTTGTGSVSMKTVNGVSVSGVAATIPNWGGSLFAGSTGTIYDLLEYGPVTSALSSPPSSAANDGYVRQENLM